jgi:hypothetical protein
MTSKRNILSCYLLGFISLFIIITIAITACPSPGGGVGGAEGTITINFNTGARTAAWPSEKNAGILPYLEHKVTLKNGSVPHTQTIAKGETSASFRVVAGIWDVTVEAYFDTYKFATGASSVDVKAGVSNPCSVTMKQADEGAEYLLASTTQEWNDALQTISNGGNNKRYVIFVVKNIEDIRPPLSGPTFINNFTGTVTICGDHKLSQSKIGNTGPLLNIYGDQNVILQDTDLVGPALSFNNDPLVCITGINASFTMKGSSSVSENYSSANDGGGVYVDGGTFTMQGSSKVCDNINSAGGGSGGVRVVNGGTFTMEGSAKVCNNTGGSGGGVYLNGGTFTMKGNASVYSNESTNGGSGGGVFITTTASGLPSKFTMEGDSSVFGNKSANVGGGVYVTTSSGGPQSEFTMQGNASVSGNTSVKNSSDGDGGGVYVDGGTFTMEGSASVSGNIAGGNGGGVYVTTQGEFTMKDSASVFRNESQVTSTFGGGGVYIDGYGTFTMQGNSSVAGNTSQREGGGVFVFNGTFHIQSGTVVGKVDYKGLAKNTAAALGNNSAALYREPTYGIVTHGNSSIPLLSPGGCDNTITGALGEIIP